MRFCFAALPRLRRISPLRSGSLLLSPGDLAKNSKSKGKLLLCSTDHSLYSSFLNAGRRARGKLLLLKMKSIVTRGAASCVRPASKRLVVACRAQGRSPEEVASRRVLLAQTAIAAAVLISGPAHAKPKKSGPVVLTKAQMMEKRRRDRQAALKEKMEKVRETKIYTVD
ncbi:hypothetical protein BSKO_05164 [Bryopsis sp. KO-2023]|nr:hypothetical protein BSKO_05164 [Bryopsis sp. KO-2023]